MVGVLLSALVGVLAVGLVNSLLDAPRFTFLSLLVAFAALASVRNGRSNGPSNGASDGASEGRAAGARVPTSGA